VQRKTSVVSHSPTPANSIAAQSTQIDDERGGRHVLIADGNADSRQRRRSQLIEAGVRVSVARTGFEAIVKASCEVPDLILIDDSLPDLDAVETGRLITTCPSTAHIPIVRISAGRRVPARVFTRLRTNAV
jgi:CheY-like chemotaxis protein